MEKEKSQSGTETPGEKKRPWSKPQISNMNGPIVVQAHGDGGKILVMDDAGETTHYRTS